MTDKEWRCPNCDLEWVEECEQTVCIEMHDQCITCHFRDNMPEGRTHDEAQVELAEISAERKARAEDIQNDPFGET